MTDTATTPTQVSIATVWLDGCSGCHMSFLDMDQRLVEIAPLIRLVHSPVVDTKQIPESTDVGIIEGAISNEHDLHRAQEMRRCCEFLISLGDCAVTGNVPSMRNVFELDACFNRAYHENTDVNPGIPHQTVPPLLDKVLPVHAVVDVDLYLPGCPPPADAIYYVLTELINGRQPDPMAVSRFGK